MVAVRALVSLRTKAIVYKVLDHVRAALTEAARGADSWPSPRLAARATAVPYLACGLMSVVSLAPPRPPGQDVQGILVLGATAVLLAAVIWFLPWERLPGWMGLSRVVVGLALLALLNSVEGNDPYLYGVFFVVVFVWIGVVYPPLTALKLLPLFAAAYLLPLIHRSGDVALAAQAGIYVGILCLLVAEVPAWLVARWRRSQTAMQDALAAVDDMCLQLGGEEKDAPSLWQASAARLCDLLDVPNCDIYRVTDDESLVCLGSMEGGKPYPEYLGKRGELSLWAVDRKAMETHSPVLVPSPDDPRLSPEERAEMLAWNEQAVLLVPLVIAGDVIGVVEFGETRAGRTISPEHAATAASICRLVALAVHDAEVIEDREIHARRLASLLESSRAIVSAASMEEALAIVTHSAVELFGLTSGIAYEYDPQLDAIVSRAMWEVTPSGWNRLGEPLPLDESPIVRDLLASGGTLLESISDSQLDPVSRATMERWGDKSCLTVPMQSVDGPMGLLMLWDSVRERHYTDDELTLATSLAELAGEAVRSAKLLRRLQHLSETDSLTGLANHRKIHEFLALEQARAERYGSRFSLAMLDLDDFKLLNDTYGHPAGDVVLRQVAGLLKEQTRASDIVGRYGGDEFLLVLPETTAVEARVLAEKLRAAIARTPYLTPAGEQIPICASFGIAGLSSGRTRCQRAGRRADANLYASKRRGGDAVTGADEAEALQSDDGGAFGLFESLVTAVDNKDRYTRRHSEEVTAARSGAGRGSGTVGGKPAGRAGRRSAARCRQDRHPRPHPAQAGTPVGGRVRDRQGAPTPRRDDHRRHTRRRGGTRRRRLPSRTLRRQRLPSRLGQR